MKRAFFPYVPSISDSAKRSLEEQAALFRELGYDGAGELTQELGFPGFGHPKGATVAQRRRKPGGTQPTAVDEARCRLGVEGLRR